METFIALVIIIVFMTVLFLIIGTIITTVDKTKITVGKIFNSEERKINKLTEELKIIHYQLLLTSERFKNCHNDFIKELHETMEEDEDYKKDLRLSLLAVCVGAIIDESDLNDYINCLEQECEKSHIFVQEAMNKYDDGTSFWEQLAKHADNEYFNEVSYMFWYEHFLLAQGLMINAWRKDKKGDNSYLYPEQKDNTLNSIL